MSFSNSYTLNLDIKKDVGNIIPVFVAYDTATLYMSVMDNGRPLDLSAVDKITIEIERPDKLIVSGVGSLENGMLKYTFGATEMELEGTLTVIAQFYSLSTRISTKPFKIKVIGDLQPDVASSDALPLIQQLQTDGAYARGQGNALGHKGTYSSTATYNENNIVTFNNINYICIQNTTAGIDPTNGIYWTQLSPLSRNNSQKWIATANQIVFTITNGIYVTASNSIQVFVNGLLKISGTDYTETNSTSFTLSSAVSSGTVVYARWVEGAASISKTHHDTHQAGGQDELDVTLLKNYPEQIANKINAINTTLGSTYLNTNAKNVTDAVNEVESRCDALSQQISGIQSPSSVSNPLNLFDKTTALYGGYIKYTTGVPTTLSGYWYSIYIPVQPGAYYQANNQEQLAIYDSTQTFIAGAIGAINGLVIPTNGAYVRLSVKDNEMASYTFNKINKTNIFTSAGITQGYYVNYTTGTLTALSGYQVSDYIPVNPNTRYLGANNEQLAWYDSSKTFISGSTGSQVDTNPAYASDFQNGVTSPTNAAYVRLSVKDAQVPNMAFYSTTSVTSAPNPYKSVVTVGKDSYSDFSTISNAIAWAKGFGASKKVTIKIKPGTYQENLDFRGNTNMSLIGESKHDCIVLDTTGEYANTPMMASGDGLVQNLTFIQNHDSNPNPAWPTGYAVHCDYEGTGTLEFQNCRFESYQNAAVGIGMHQSQTLKFRNCEFYKTSTNYDGGCIYFHNNVTSGVTAQWLYFENCTAIADDGCCIRADDANIGSGDGLGNTMTVTFIRNTFYSKAQGSNSINKNTSPIGTGTFVGNVKLDPMSSGNNATGCNV